MTDHRNEYTLRHKIDISMLPQEDQDFLRNMLADNDDGRKAVHISEVVDEIMSEINERNASQRPTSNAT